MACWKIIHLYPFLDDFPRNEAPGISAMFHYQRLRPSDAIFSDQSFHAAVEPALLDPTGRLGNVLM